MEKAAVGVNLGSLSCLVLFRKTGWLTGEGEIDDTVEREQDRNEVKICLSYPPSAVTACGTLGYCSFLNTGSLS